MSSGSLGVEMPPVTVKDKLKADFMWRQDFHSWLSHKWKDADIKENTWWKQEKFENSIFEVMKKAMVDCVLKQGFFEEKNHVKYFRGGKRSIFRFVRAEPTQVKYTQENWNALMLYNVIYKLFYDATQKEVKTILREASNNLSDYYGTDNNGFKKFIEKAQRDIKAYIFDLGLDDYLQGVNESIRKQRINKMIQASSSSVSGNVIKSTCFQICCSRNLNTYTRYSNFEFNIDFKKDKENNLKLKAKLSEKYDDQILSFPSCQSVQGLVEGNDNGKFILTKDWKEKVINELPKNYALDVITYDPKIAQKNTLEWIENMYKTYGIFSQQEQSKRIKNKAIPKPRSTNEINKRDSKKSDLKNEYNALQNLVAQNKELEKAVYYIYGESSAVLSHKNVEMFYNNLEKWKKACQDVYEVAITICQESTSDVQYIVQQVVESTMSNALSRQDIKLYLTQFNDIKMISAYNIYQNDKEILYRFAALQSQGTDIEKWVKACQTVANACKDRISDKDVLRRFVDSTMNNDFSPEEVELYVQYCNTVQNISACNIYKDDKEILGYLKVFNSGNKGFINEFEQACITCIKLCNVNKITDKANMKNIVEVIFKHSLSEEQAKLYVKNYAFVHQILDYGVYEKIPDILDQLANFGNDSKKIELWFSVCKNAQQNYEKLGAKKLMPLSVFVNKMMADNGNLKNMEQYITKQLTKIKPNNYTHEQIDEFRTEYNLPESEYSDDLLRAKLSSNNGDYEKAFKSLLD